MLQQVFTFLLFVTLAGYPEIVKGSARESTGAAVQVPVPLIGSYSEPYKFAGELFRITGPEIMAVVPSELKKLCESATNVYGGVVFWSASELPRPAVSDNKQLTPSTAVAATYNSVFHYVMRYWRTGGTKDTSDFNETIQAGIFKANGIVPAREESISIGTLGKLTVHQHGSPDGPGTAFSPNNGRFGVLSGRKLVSFWLVGLWNQRAIITYNVLLLEQAFSIRELVPTIDMLEYMPATEAAKLLLNALEIILSEMPSKSANGTDADTVSQVITVLQQIASSVTTQEYALQQLYSHLLSLQLALGRR